MLHRVGAAAGRLVAKTSGVSGRAGVSSRATVSYSEVPKVLQEKMRHFQLPNNLPVHVKGGPTDKILYFITAVVCTVGVLDCFRVYYHLSYPSPKTD